MTDARSGSNLEPELRDCYEQTRKVNQAVEDLVRDLTDAQLQWRPQPSMWSIIQCLEHLLVTARADLPSIRRAIVEGRSRKLSGRGPFRYGLLSRLLIKSMGAESKLKFKSPRIYRPVGDKSTRDVIREFFLAQKEVLDCIQDANGLHLARTKVSLPGHSYIKLSLGQELKLLVVHEQRHVLQARKIKSLPGFPSSHRK